MYHHQHPHNLQLQHWSHTKRKQQLRNSPQIAIAPVRDITNQNVPEFDILDFINDNTDEEILLAATQMEKEYATASTVTSTSTTTTLVKEPPARNPIQMPTFSGCRIANVHIHINKN